MIAVTVQPGDTLSQIASEYGTTYQAVAQASGISNPNVIYAGEKVIIPAGGSFAPAPVQQAPQAAPVQTQPQAVPASSGSSGGLTDIPGVPSSFVQCVAYRESTNGTNQAYDGGVYGIINASGYHVNGQSVAVQKQAFASIYHSTGPSAWSADGCPGT